MGNTVPPRASSCEATGTGRRGAGTGRRRSKNVVVTEAAASPATPNLRVVATARKQGRDHDDDDGDVEEETTRAAGRPRAGRALRAGGDDGAAAPATGGKVLITVKIVMTRKDAEALVARLKLKAQSARERKARMAQLEGELRARSCGGASRRDARRPMLPPIKEDRFERITHSV